MGKNLFWMGETPSFTARVEKAMGSLNNKYSGRVKEDRDRTIGASEINCCARRVILSKRRPEDFGYGTLAKFFRGHRQEEFNAPIHRIIASEDGLCWIPQLRVHLPRNPRIRAHVDNVYYHSPDRSIEKATDICVVEEKNAAEVAAEPLDDYVAQVHYQMGLLHLNYPQASVAGTLYQTDLNGNHTDFGPPFRVDMIIAEELFVRGEEMLAWLDAGAVPDPEPSLKCGWCPHIGTCPKWHDPTNPPVPESVANLVRRYNQLQMEIEGLTAEKKAMNAKLKTFFSAQGKTRFRGETSPGYFVRIGQDKGKESCDNHKLRTKYPDVAADVLKQGNPYLTLQVTCKSSN